MKTLKQLDSQSTLSPAEMDALCAFKRVEVEAVGSQLKTTHKGITSTWRPSVDGSHWHLLSIH